MGRRVGQLPSRAMWLTQDDARSDFILAAAAFLFLDSVQRVALRLPLYPDSGMLGLLLATAWLFASTGLVPLLLARYRKQGAKAFGLDIDRAGLRSGVIFAVPFIAALAVSTLVGGAGTVTEVALGKLHLPFSGGVVGSSVTGSVEAILIVFAIDVVYPLGLGLLIAFLAIRGKDGFRQPDVGLTEGLRTFGMGAVAAMLLFGLLRSFQVGPLEALMPVVALAAVVLLTDKLVPISSTVSRAALLGPGIVLALTYLRPFALFSGNLLGALYFGSTLFGIGIIGSVLVLTKRHAWAIFPLLFAMANWSSVLLF